MTVLICLAMCAINIPFIVQDPTRWLNWAAAVFCFVMAMACAILEAGS